MRGLRQTAFAFLFWPLLSQALPITEMTFNALLPRGSKPIPKTAEDYRVKSLPLIDSDVLPEMYAGYITVHESTNTDLFFWTVKTDNVIYNNEGQNGTYNENGVKINGNNKTVIWLNGGPGCSSMDGALMEIGPFRVGKNGPEINHGAWHESVNVIYIDQPAGTGLSRTDKSGYIHELPEVCISPFVSVSRMTFY